MQLSGGKPLCDICNPMRGWIHPTGVICEKCKAGELVTKEPEMAQRQAECCPECQKARRENVRLYHKTNGKAGVPYAKCELVFCSYHNRMLMEST